MNWPARQDACAEIGTLRMSGAFQDHRSSLYSSSDRGTVRRFHASVSQILCVIGRFSLLLVSNVLRVSSQMRRDSGVPTRKRSSTYEPCQPIKVPCLFHRKVRAGFALVGSSSSVFNKWSISVAAQEWPDSLRPYSGLRRSWHSSGLSSDSSRAVI